MKKFLAKIIIAVFVGMLVGGVSFYFWKNKYASGVDAKAIESESEKVNENILLAAEQARAAEEKRKAESNEAQIISYVEKNINRIASVHTNSQTNWEAVRIWFLDAKNFYVDYKDSSANQRRFLVNQISEGRAASYEVLGYFTPGNNGWVLESGKDIKDLTPIKMYEKNEKTKEWIVK